MKFNKKVLSILDHCYSTAVTRIDGQRYFLFASEAPAPCYAFNEKTLEQETVWDLPGGTMSMIPVPGTNGDFLAVQNFRSGFKAEDTVIVWVRKTGKVWESKTILKFPFIHRFDIIEIAEKKYLFISTLATSKKDKADWSDPGKLYIAPLPEFADADVTTVIPEVIYSPLTRNHGYFRYTGEKRTTLYVTSDEGVFEIIPPVREGWKINKICSRPASDVAVVDIDNDGEPEYALIEPFHGNKFTLNKRDGNTLKEIYSYGGDFDFGHVVWGGKILGEPAFIGGARRGAKELFIITRKPDGTGFETRVIESGAGPSNVFAAEGNEKNTAIILTANREIGEAALITISLG